jgi:hypothetical protein
MRLVAGSRFEQRSDGIDLWFACEPIIRLMESRPSEPRIFKAISEFCTTRNRHSDSII